MLAARVPPKVQPVTVCDEFATIGVTVIVCPHKVWSPVQPLVTIVKVSWKAEVLPEPV